MQEWNLLEDGWKGRETWNRSLDRETWNGRDMGVGQEMKNEEK